MNLKYVLTTTAVVAASALVLTACGSDSSKTSTTTAAGGSSGASTATIASTLVFGGPAQFKTRNDGIPGLQSTYGIAFKTVETTDIGGPVTVSALKTNKVDIADLFSTDPAIEANGFVVLKDDKSNFGAQNVVPLITKSKATTGVLKTLDAVSAKLSTDGLRTLRTQVETDKKDPTTVAKDWLKTNGLDTTGSDAAGVSIKVGSAGFQENVVIANIYAEALRVQGASITTQFGIGERSKYYPALKNNEINLIPEYNGSILSYLDAKATAKTTSDVDTALATALPATLVAGKSAEAQDSDALVVTKTIADKYKLTNISDLAKTS